MPEMPEVDHVARVLDFVMVGRRITAVELLSSKLAVAVTPREFVRRTQGKVVKSVSRRGKFMIVRLSSGDALLMHLRMTGSILYAGPLVQFDRCTRLVFRLDDGSQIAFHDARHLGRIRLVEWRKVWEQPELKKLGIEPLGGQFTPACLAALLAASRRPVKEFLLDQTRIVGLGNIYAAETLFRARLSPRLSCRRLARSSLQAGRLYRAIIVTLRLAFAAQGTEPTHMEFIDIDPFAGQRRRRPREDFLVYDREGEPCRRCGNPIARIKQGNRSTYYCRACQR